MTATDLTREERAEADRMLAELHENGYIDVDGHKELKAGIRVRHTGHRWPEAFENGSGVVLAVTEKPNSSWSRSWGGPDVELIVAWDLPSFRSRLSRVANYHVVAVSK